MQENELKKKEINSITFVSEEAKGVPLQYYNYKYKFLFLEGNSIFICLLPLMFPFVLTVWIVTFIIMAAMFYLSRKKIPTWQSFRFFRRKLSKRIIYPNTEQKERDRRGFRPWPF